MRLADARGYLTGVPAKTDKLHIEAAALQTNQAKPVGSAYVDGSAPPLGWCALCHSILDLFGTH